MARVDQDRDIDAVVRSAALEMLGNGVVITDRDANILYVNRAFETITGYAAEEALGRNMSVLKSGHQSKAFYTRMWAAIQGGGQWHGTLWNRRKNGETYHERLLIRRFTGPVGEVYYVGAFSDLSEQDELQRALIDAQKRELMASLTGGVVHNFNNYMAAIQGFAYMGRKVTTDDRVRHYFSEILQATTRTSELVRDLMKVSWASTSKQGSFDAMSVMRDSLKTAGSMLSKTIDLTVKVPALDTCEIKGSGSDIEQVMLNLFANARDALQGRSDAWIRVEVMKSRKSLEDCQRYCPRTLHCPVNSEENLITIVEDNGAGIPEDVQNRIFDPFFTTKGEKGSGLGLASVSHIVNRMGGAIWVTSRVDMGTRFHLCLPVLPPCDGQSGDTEA